MTTVKRLGLLAYHGDLLALNSLLTIVRTTHSLSLMTITQGERQATCIIESSEVSSCDQTARCLLSILPLTGQVSSTATLYRG